MTRKLFWEYPYRTALAARVSRVEGPLVYLDSTIFFAFSGGQESDWGTIGGHRVLEARVSGSDIAYALGDSHGLKAGDPVDVFIDWERRYRLMRLHFAAELTLETVNRRFPGIVKTGAHIAERKARLDFSLGESISPYLPEIAESVESLIDSDFEIHSAFADRETERRYWEIEKFARVSCGGTHLRRTGEIGTIGLKRNNIGKGRERIEIILVE